LPWPIALLTAAALLLQLALLLCKLHEESMNNMSLSYPEEVDAAEGVRQIILE
jgi:hypothetical protein